jgi:hypothetical protein
MPIHFEDLNVLSEVAELRTALIVPCNMCPAVTVALRENKPFMQLSRSFLKSAPFEEYLGVLRSRLAEKGVRTEIFRSNLYHQWFMCMWTAGRQKKLRERAIQYDAVIVLGCDSATVTVRDAVESTGCRVIEGMKVTGIMNAKLKFRLPGTLSFADCKTIPIAQGRNGERGRVTDSPFSPRARENTGRQRREKIPRSILRDLKN